MKYIVTRQADGKERIFVFERDINHDFMLEGIQAVKRGSHHDWTRSWDAEAVSAGFIDNGKCHGESETLRLMSRGAQDTALLAFWMGK